MKYFISVTLLVCQCCCIAQTKALYISPNEKLSQDLGQSLLPITTDVSLADQTILRITFFDFVYSGSVNEHSGKFIAAAKPGESSIVRHHPILNDRFTMSDESYRHLLEDPNAPDTIILASIDGIWSNGSMNFKVTAVKMISKIPHAVFDNALLQQIKTSPKLNFTIPTTNIKVKLKDDKTTILAIKPFFTKDHFSFVVVPQQLYKVDQIENSSSQQDTRINYSNCSMQISYELMNYFTNLYYSNKNIRVKKDDLNFDISKVKIVGKADGALVTGVIHLKESKTVFDAMVKLGTDMTFQTCTLKPRAKDVFSVQLAKLAEKKINENFSNKNFIRAADLSQVFPFKLRGKSYKLYIDILKINLEPTAARVHNQFFIEQQ